MPRPSSKADVLTLLKAMLVLGLPVVATLLTVRGLPYGDHEHDSPYGYTVSLSLFILPVLAIGYRHIVHPRHWANRQGLIGSAAAIAILGFILDIGFGHSFFVFPNTHATLGIRLPAWSFDELRWIPSYLPIEEFGFYIFGGLFLVTVYLWFDQDWLTAYDPDEYGAAARAKKKLIHVSPRILLLWAALVVAGFLYKEYGPQPYGAGFPGYFVFLMTLGLLPAFLCIKGISEFVNWRAFACSSLVMLFVSVIWEATLALPYGWWNYRREHMIGITITAWARLPVEAVLLWMVAAWASLIAFEFFRVYAHMGRSPMHALFGKKPTTHSGAGPAT